MKKTLLRFLLAGILATAAATQEPVFATNLTGTFHKPDGSPVNGKLIFLLSQPGRLADNSAQVVPIVRIFSVTNGQLEPGAFIYGNDVLVPTGTHYLVRLVDASNNMLFEQKWSIQGTNLDLGTLTPTTTGVTLPDPLVKNVTTDQAVQGPVTFNSGLTALSLTLNGSLNPGANDLFDLGTSSARWREIHTNRLNGWAMPGTTPGLVTPPTAAPAVSNTMTGGTIPAGTYYIKVTYLTCTNAACTNFGETPVASASQTVVTTGATSRLQVAPGDKLWQSGAIGYYTYASNDDVTFYRQTLNPANGNQTCQLDTEAHIVNCSSGAVLTSLVFSGTQPPSANTAAIGPLQVALNSITTFGAPNSTSGIVLSNDLQLLTTPLVLGQNMRLDCNGMMNSQGGTPGRVQSAIDNPNLATVVIASGNVSVDGCDIVNTAGNALLLQNAISGGSSVKVSNGSIRTNATTNTYAAAKIKGIWYDLEFQNNYMRGDKAAIHAKGTSGSNWTFRGRRWDIGGDYAVWHEPAVTDPDNDANFGAFPNAVSVVNFEKILVENGDREWFNALNMTFTVRDCQFADPTTLSSTVGMFRIGTTALTGAASMGPILFDNVSTQNHANFGSGVYVDQMNGVALGFVTAFGSSFGNTINLVDYNNVTPAPRVAFYNTVARPYEAATSRRFINIPSTNFPTVIGSSGEGVAEGQRGMNSLYGSLIFVDHTNNTNRRTMHWRSTGIWSWYECDSATTACLTFDWDPGDLRFYKSDGTSHLMHLNRNSTGGNTVGFGRTAPASGIVGFANNEAIVARNAANSTEVSLIRLNTSDQLELGGPSTGFPKFMASGGNAPFMVNSGVSKVTNLDSDKWDGKDALDFSASLDFGAVATQSCAELTITTAGATAGSPIAPSWPAALDAGLIGIMRVSAADTVTVRLCNVGPSSVDPAGQTFAGRIIK